MPTMKIMRHTFRRSRRFHALLSVFCIGTISWNLAHAAVGDPPAAERRLDSQWQAVADDRLIDLRGGFDVGNGLQISIGIQRAVYIDGNLVTTTSLTLPDLANIAKPTAAQARALSASAGTISLVQNGPGNTFDPGPISSSTVATVVQNTLDNRHIQSMTVIDATANSLGLLKAMNFQSGLRDALSTSVGGK
jgi:hypothetical protein